MSSPRHPPRETERDHRDDQRVLLWTTGLLLVTFSLGSTLQTIFVFRPERLTAAQLAAEAPLLPARLYTNLATVAVVLLVCWLAHLSRRPPLARAVWVAAIAVVAGFARHGLQLLLGIYVHPALTTSVVEIASVTGAVLLSIGLALVHVQTRVRLRIHEREFAERRLRASVALAELAAQDVRIRHDVAEGLRRGLASIGENGVRELLRLADPPGVDVGLGRAVDLLVARIPPGVALTADVSPEADSAAAGADPDALQRRVALLHAAEEAVANALLHGAATQIRIRAHATSSDRVRVIRLTVDDDGSGLPDAPQWKGLAQIADRIRRHGGAVRLSSSPLGGGRLEVMLPPA